MDSVYSDDTSVSIRKNKRKPRTPSHLVSNGETQTVSESEAKDIPGLLVTSELIRSGQLILQKDACKRLKITRREILLLEWAGALTRISTPSNGVLYTAKAIEALAERMGANRARLKRKRTKMQEINAERRAKGKRALPAKVRKVSDREATADAYDEAAHARSTGWGGYRSSAALMMDWAMED